MDEPKWLPHSSICEHFLHHEHIKILEPHDPEILLLRIYPKELKAHSGRYICKHLFTAALFTVTKAWKQAKCHWPRKGKSNVICANNRVLFIITKEGNSNTCYNMEEPCGHFTKWYKPDRKQLINILWFHLSKGPGVVSFTETESKMVIARNCEGERGNWWMGAEFRFCQMKKSPGVWLDKMWMYLTRLNWTLKDG